MEEFNLSQEIFNKDNIIKEADLQSGAIEFSMTGELIPLERVEVALIEFITQFRKEMDKVRIDERPLKKEGIITLLEIKLMKLVGEKLIAQNGRKWE